MPAFLYALLRSLLTAGAVAAAERVWDTWRKTGDAEAAARASGMPMPLPPSPPQPPTAGDWRQSQRRGFWDNEFNDDPLAEECRWDRFLKECE